MVWPWAIEDLNDHEQLRNDPLLAVLVEKSDPSQEALAGKSTLNRLELTAVTASAQERYKKIVLDHGAVDRLLVDVFLGAHGEAPEQIILDLDATDDPLYGKQEGRFFHGYYGHYCYLPLYIFCGEFLLCAFGDVLNEFLQDRGIKQSDAAKRLGLQKKGKARLNTYCHDSPKGKRPKPDAEILYLVCTKLGFNFEYNGYRISAETFDGKGIKPSEKETKQFELRFDRQFNLIDEQGTVTVRVN